MVKNPGVLAGALEREGWSTKGENGFKTGIRSSAPRSDRQFVPLDPGGGGLKRKIIDSENNRAM